MAIKVLASELEEKVNEGTRAFVRETHIALGGIFQDFDEIQVGDRAEFTPCNFNFSLDPEGFGADYKVFCLAQGYPHSKWDTTLAAPKKVADEIRAAVGKYFNQEPKELFLEFKQWLYNQGANRELLNKGNYDASSMTIAAKKGRLVFKILVVEEGIRIAVSSAKSSFVRVLDVRIGKDEWFLTEVSKNNTQHLIDLLAENS